MSLLISLKQNPVLHPQLLMNNTVISESTSHKHLRVFEHLLMDRTYCQNY